jgi:hypothetical protein
MIRHVQLIREDKNFMEKFNIRFDEILRENNICIRNDSGYLDFMNISLPPQQFFTNLRNSCSLASQEFATEAAAILQRLGKNAWVNEIGFISVAS